MSTSAKTCQPKNVKKAKCKMASPISNDRAEAFVGPQAEVRPRFSEVPSERDAKAFKLAAQGMTQRQIAKELKTSQPTVQRAIEKYRRWFGTTLPEDRGEMTGFSRFRVAVEERRIFLRHQMELAMEEWQQSRQPVPMVRERTKVYPEGRKAGGPEVKEVITDKYLQKRHASAAHLNAADRLSLELTMLEAGYLGVRQLSCDKAMDTDERDRWDRAVKSRDKTIEELTRKVAELEAKLAAKNSTPHAPREEVFTRSVKSTLDESRTAQTTPVLNHTSPDSAVASPIQKTPSGERPGSSRPVSQKGESDESRALSGLPNENCRVHEAERNARVSDESSAVNQPQGNTNPACISQSLMHPTSKPPEGGTPTLPDESRHPPRSSCPSDAEVASRLLQIRRLKTRH